MVTLLRVVGGLNLVGPACGKGPPGVGNNRKRRGGDTGLVAVVRAPRLALKNACSKIASALSQPQQSIACRVI